MPIKETTDTSGLSIGRTVKITVTHAVRDDLNTVVTVTGRVVSHGKALRQDGSVRSFVVFGNDTTREPSIEWMEDRYYTVTIEDAN